MKRDQRSRTERGGKGSKRVRTVLETLERREMLSVAANPYSFATLTQRSVPRESSILGTSNTGLTDGQLATLDNQGRFLTGTDRQGDSWTITVHGPGYVIVSDATPNDGVLDDSLDTIQIVGSNPHTTYITGQVTATNQNVTAPDTGEVYFNHLIALRGVQSIILNGFSLNDTVPPISGQPNNTGPAIYLPGGVHKLSFNNIYANIDPAGNGNGPDQPVEIQIGDPNTPIPRQQSPIIELNSIYNTVIDSTETSQAGLGPQTTPTVNILVNGNIHELSLTSATSETITGGMEFQFPVVDVTGRTAIRATGIDHLKVAGTARNLTASRSGTPFQGQNGQHAAPAPSTSTTIFANGFSGLDHLGSAKFGGTTDAVGLDVNGKIGKLKFARGAGNPTGTINNNTQLGYNAAQAGYPSRGLIGTLVTATKIKSVKVGEANLTLQTSNNPADQQSQGAQTQKYYPRAGAALTNVAIVSSGSIGKVKIKGDSKNSEIDTGYDYTSYVNGLEPVRNKSKIGKFEQRGDLIDSVVSASYRANDGIYGNGNDTAGPGSITGNLNGRLYVTGSQTVLGNYGAGVYAKHKKGYLPPAEKSLTNKHGQPTR